MKNHEIRRLLKKTLKEAEALKTTLALVVTEVGHIPSNRNGNNPVTADVDHLIRQVEALAKLKGVEV